jgi:hypothetical protein
MARKREAGLTCCMIVLQYEDKYFPTWTPEERAKVEMARKGNVAGMVNVMGERLAKANIGFDSVYAINHDADTRNVWDELGSRYVKENKPIHGHFVWHFIKGKGAPATLSNIAKALGIEQNFIEKPQRGRMAYDNMLAYLIHAKDANKAQYKADRVYSCGMYQNDEPMFRPYTEIYAEHKEAWEKGRAVKKVASAREDIDHLEELILTGKVTKSQVILTDDYYDVYSRNARRCEDAFRVYGERRAYKTLQALQEGDFKLTVIYIMGEPGAGKTRVAKEFVRRLIEWSAGAMPEPFRCCQTAATNPMDEYNGEEILFMDDMRGSALSASDWLKLLDPYNASPSSARYKNKQPACRAVIITSTKDPIEFFYYCKQLGGGDRSEALDQFMRRIQCLTKVFRADNFADTRAMLGSGKFGEPQVVRVPNSHPLQEDRVELSYTFDFGDKDMPVEDAVQKMLDITIHNNGTV